MRGDSLRDLYAKTLALFGLGLLAGVGALVDYWPVGVGAPQVAAADMAMPERLAALPATDLSIPVVLVRTEPIAERVTVVALTAEVGAPDVWGQPVYMLEPVAPAMAVAVLFEAPVVEAAIAGPAVAPLPDFDPQLVYRMAAAEEDSGFLSDAVDIMKTTGSTIARGGVITGTSIVGALRVVSGAFKKLKFF